MPYGKILVDQIENSAGETIDALGAVGVESRLLGVGASLYKGSNGRYVQNGDTIPADTTHLTILINGVPEDVVMSPVASGVVASLTETSATIGGNDVYFIRNRGAFNARDFVYASSYGVSVNATSSENTMALHAALADSTSVYLDANGCSFDDIIVPDGCHVYSEDSQTLSFNSITLGESVVSAAGVTWVTDKSSISFAESSATDAVSLGKWCTFSAFNMVGDGTLTDGVNATINAFKIDGGDFPTINIWRSVKGFVDVLHLIPYETGSGLTINRGKIYIKWIGSCACVINKTNASPMAFFDTEFYAEGCDVVFKGRGTMTGHHKWHFDSVNTYIDNSTATGAIPLRLGHVEMLSTTYSLFKDNVSSTRIYATTFRFRDLIVHTRAYDSPYTPTIIPFDNTHMIIGVDGGVQTRHNVSSANAIHGMPSVNDVVEGITHTFGDNSFGSFVIERLNRTKLFELNISGKATLRSGATFGTQFGIDNDVNLVNNSSLIIESTSEGYVHKATDGLYYKLQAPVGGGTATWVEDTARN